MEISYKTTELRDLFQFPAKAFARHGATFARALAIRFADLRALQNAAELVAFSAQDCEIQDLPALELPISDGHSAIIVPNHPKSKGVPIPWSKVTRVKVVSISCPGCLNRESP